MIINRVLPLLAKLVLDNKAYRENFGMARLLEQNISSGVDSRPLSAPENEVELALDIALEAGYRHIDTSPIYQNEKAIGRVLKTWMDTKDLKREDIFIVTKLPPMGNRPSCVEKYLRNSLNDLQLTYVDLYLIHAPFGLPETDGDFKCYADGSLILDTDTDHIVLWQKMEEMIQLGLTRSIGVSNFNASQIERLITIGTIKPANLQIELHIYLQQNELVDLCKKNGIVVTAYSPLGSRGITNINAMAGIDRQLPNLMENEVVVRIANDHEKTPAQILLRWILQRGIAAIPKSTNPERLKENFNVFDFELTYEEMLDLAELDSGVRVCDFEFFKGVKDHPEFPW